MEGASLTFLCPPGLTLIGPESSRCMGNGEWEPDPREAVCIGKSIVYGHRIVLYMHANISHTAHILSIAPAANCNRPPSPPKNGHILPYTNTLEGARVIYLCWNIYHEDNESLCAEVNTTAVCNEHGNWELISQDLCSVFSGQLCS